MLQLIADCREEVNNEMAKGDDFALLALDSAFITFRRNS
jgi:hypothetical protein